MAEAKESTFRWLSEPCWSLWEGGFLLLARAEGVVPPHAHHAIQIVIGIDGTLGLSGENGWQHGNAFIVRSDVPHSFDCSGSLGAMLFVDPESYEGRLLHATYPDSISAIPINRLASCSAEIQGFAQMGAPQVETCENILRCVNALCAGIPRLRRPDPRISNVVAAVRAREDLRMSLEEAADLAFLSPSRFAHLFKQQIGVPFSRYMLWRKLTRAMVAIASEETISSAAHAADFADAAHFTRTFYQMIGMSPSALMRGTLTEIPSPFMSVCDELSAC